MVSEDLAELNGLQLGDQVELFAYYLASGGENVTATLTGIYGIEEYLPHTQSPYFNSENLLYVTPDVAQLLNGPQSGAYSVTCVSRTRSRPPTSWKRWRGMGLPEGGDLRFVIDDGQYRAVKSAIQASTRIAWAALISSIAVGGTVLILLTLLQLRSRDHEIGVLLALGEDRGKIYAQLLGESLVPILLAMAGTVAPVAPHLPGGELAVPGQPHPAAPGERPRGAGPVPQRPGPHPLRLPGYRPQAPGLPAQNHPHGGGVKGFA